MLSIGILVMVMMFDIIKGQPQEEEKHGQLIFNHHSPSEYFATNVDPVDLVG